MESLWGFLTMPRERGGFFRTVEVEKALRNAGGTRLSLISAPAWMHLFVCTIPGHRPATSQGECRPAACGGIPGQPWSSHGGLRHRPPPHPPAMKPMHKPTLMQKVGGELSCLACARRGGGEHSGDWFKIGLISFAPVGPRLCQGSGSCVALGSHTGFAC